MAIDRYAIVDPATGLIENVVVADLADWTPPTGKTVTRTAEISAITNYVRVTGAVPNEVTELVEEVLMGEIGPGQVIGPDGRVDQRKYSV